MPFALSKSSKQTNANLLKEVFGVIQKWKTDNDYKSNTFVIGCSGGVDSTSLALALYVLSKHKIYGKEFSDLNVTLVHFNHHFRKDGTSERDALFVETLADKFGYDYVCMDLNPAEIGENENSHNWAHNIRMQLLNTVSSSKGYAPILLAHHKDDRIEHFLVHKLVCGRMHKKMEIVNDLFVRPFYNLPKSVLYEFCKFHNQDWREDPTNASAEKYTRNKVRNVLLPFLKTLFPESNIEQNILLLEDLLKKV